MKISESEIEFRTTMSRKARLWFVVPGDHQDECWVVPGMGSPLEAALAVAAPHKRAGNKMPQLWWVHPLKAIEPIDITDLGEANDQVIDAVHNAFSSDYVEVML